MQNAEGTGANGFKWLRETSRGGKKRGCLKTQNKEWPKEILMGTDHAK